MAIRFHWLQNSVPGVLRLTFVRPEHLFDSLAHERNSFYFSYDNSCLVSLQNKIDVNGLSFIGSAGFLPTSMGCKMYLTTVKIPQVLSDGEYVLTVTCIDEKEGWCFSNEIETSLESIQVCQQIRISGGEPLQSARLTSMTELDGIYLLDENLISKSEKKSIKPGRCSSFAHHNKVLNAEAGVTHRFERESLRSTFSRKYQERSPYSISPNAAKEHGCYAAKRMNRYDLGSKSKIILLALRHWVKVLQTQIGLRKKDCSPDWDYENELQPENKIWDSEIFAVQ